MRLVQYTPDDFPALVRAAEEMTNGDSLRHRPFVDHYYATHPGCRLYLVRDDQGEIAGTLGVDKMTMRLGDSEIVVAAGSNFQALQKGVGGLLFFQWVKSAPMSLVFGGSEDTHRIVSARKWTYFPGVKLFTLNHPPEFHLGEPAWRKAAKRVRHLIRPPKSPARRLAAVSPGDLAGLDAIEEFEYRDDLLPTRSPFAFRFAPDPDYLRWRYGLGLSFVRYRVFRIVRDGVSAGYAILNERPDVITVAQADADDPATLANGILLSLVAATKADRTPRALTLVSSHPAMQAIFTRFGFRPSKLARRFVLGTARGGVDLPADTSNWLVNLDWTDNGLRAPFLDQ